MTQLRILVTLLCLLCPVVADPVAVDGNTKLTGSTDQTHVKLKIETPSESLTLNLTRHDWETLTKAIPKTSAEVDFRGREVKELQQLRAEPRGEVKLLATPEDLVLVMSKARGPKHSFHLTYLEARKFVDEVSELGRAQP